MLEEVVRRLVGLYLSSRDLRVRLALARLPAVGPEPCLVSRNGDMGMQLYDAVVALDDFDLRAGLIELMAPTDVRRQRQSPAALQCHARPIGTARIQLEPPDSASRGDLVPAG